VTDTVAVCVPTIPGREAMLKRALASVRAQRRQPDEVLVELDSDRTGAAATRNRLLDRCTSDWIAWCDDDDSLLPNHLRVLMKEASYGDADLIYPTPRMVGGRDPTATSVNGKWRLPWGVPFGPEQERHLRVHGSFIPITHLVRAELVRKVGGFRDGYRLPSGRFRGEDEAYLIALLDAGARFAHVNDQTWLWQVHEAHTAGRGVAG
jgi:glycosyltransferase involved in cell wall biosynthesis